MNSSAARGSRPCSLQNVQVNRNSVFHRFGLRCFNLFERLCGICCVAIKQKSDGKGGQGWKGWSRGAEADTANLVLIHHQITTSRWHSFCKWRRHFKATPLLCQAVLAVPMECWRAACWLQACSRIRSEAQHNASSTRCLNVQESFITFWSWSMWDWKSCLREIFAWKACRRWSNERG